MIILKYILNVSYFLFLISYLIIFLISDFLFLDFLVLK